MEFLVAFEKFIAFSSRNKFSRSVISGRLCKHLGGANRFVLGTAQFFG
jgi:hypothetical protein